MHKKETIDQSTTANTASKQRKKTLSVAPKLSDERLRLWLNFWKFAIVSGAVALVGAVVPPIINYQKELAIKEIEVRNNLDLQRHKADAESKQHIILLETKYISEFFEKVTTENIETRYRYVQYLAALTKDPDYKQGWKDLRDQLREEREKVRRELAAAQREEYKQRDQAAQIGNQKEP